MLDGFEVRQRHTTYSAIKRFDCSTPDENKIMPTMLENEP